ncbi:hypothetical protein J437_LFUL017114 [Ladona fulva]|uniref:ADP-ribosylation factor-like protein 3 n=1 Tax=Ladona fulva TaxID=123851 RepID=A0A8K0KMH0_LADFU|nr:hypothetical protein J437_LFUL017114 [Ladona fulva]
MEVARSNKVVKSFIVIGSGVVLGLGAYAAFKYWKKRNARIIDEGFEDVSRLEETPDKKVLVLGLENAGKSTILSQITAVSCKNTQQIMPTEGFVNTRLQSGERPLSIWEVGGGARRYWVKFLQDTDLLVFVVDSCNPNIIPQASKELKKLLGDVRLAEIPILLLANKQDLPGAMNPKEVSDALDLESFPNMKSRLKVIGTQALPLPSGRHSSVVEVEKALYSMTKDL